MNRTKRVCSKPLCGEIVTSGYCPAHAPQDTRPSARKRGYDRQWEAVRKQHLALHPVCTATLPDGSTCNAVATEVDHIDGDPFNNAPDNHRSRCKPCHSRRTAKDQAFGRREAGWKQSARPATPVLA